jgi:hypothetical protein
VINDMVCLLGAPLLLEIITRARRRRGQISRLLNSNRRDSYKAGPILNVALPSDLITQMLDIIICDTRPFVFIVRHER